MLYNLVEKFTADRARWRAPAALPARNWMKSEFVRRPTLENPSPARRRREPDWSLSGLRLEYTPSYLVGLARLRVAWRAVGELRAGAGVPANAFLNSVEFQEMAPGEAHHDLSPNAAGSRSPSGGAVPHRIRLRGPWEIRVLSAPSDAATADETESDSLAVVDRVHLPAPVASLFAERSGRVVLSRRFHKPTNVAPGQIVELVLPEICWDTLVSLNGQMLARLPAGATAHRLPVTDRLQPTNVLALEFEVGRTPSPESDDVWGEFALEISEHEILW